MNYDFPIKYYEDNLIFKNDTRECWACFKVIGVNYEFLSKDKSILILNRLSRFIASIGVEAQILVIPVIQNVNEHYERLVAGLNKNDALYKYGKAHAYGTRDYLLGRTEYAEKNSDYAVYVITRLTAARNFYALIDAVIRRPIKTVEEIFAVGHKEILQSELKMFLEQSDAYFKDQTKRIMLEKTDSQTTQWLLRRMMRRGVPGAVKIKKNGKDKPWNPHGAVKIKDGQKAIRPHKKDILTLMDAVIEPDEKHIKITNNDGKVSYQKFLAIAHIPDIEFPGSEWLLALQDYPISSEVCIHITTEEYRQSLKKVSGKIREIKSQTEHVAENDEVPDELYEAKDSAEGLEAELKAYRDSIAMTSITICVASEDPKDLEEKAKLIKTRYEDFNFMIEAPRTDQFKLFMGFIPGAGRYVTDYILPLPPRTLAGSMFPATRMLGDNIGPYIGTTGILEKLVFLDIKRACLLNRSASIAIIGTLGGGKSFNANVLMYLNILYGGYGLIFDPKGERSNWPMDIPELKEHISIITLSASDEDAGKLDPFLIYRDNLNDAEELAINILCEIFKINPKDAEYIAILEAAKRTKESENPCMSVLAECLEDFAEDDILREKAIFLARRIKATRETGMAKLLFGTGKEEGLRIKNRLSILQIQNLVMPDPTTPKEDYTVEETLSTVLMLPIASFAHKFAMSDRTVFKLINFDEAWALKSTQMGKKLMNSLARLGRSLYAGCIFIGHSVKDVDDEGIKAALTYKFCFKSTDINEIKRVLAFLDLEETDANISEVKNLQNGECLFQDLDGRVGKLRFDYVYKHLRKAFNTTPEGDAEQKGA